MEKTNIIKKLCKWGLLSIFFGFAFFYQPAFAAQGIQDKTILNEITKKSGVSNVGSAETLAGSIIKAVLSITGLIFLILMVYAGILWMTARGDEARIEKSKDIIEAALIGLAVTVSAYAITLFVTGQILKE